MSRLLISFSGGETSAYMTKRLLEESAEKYKQIVIAFANTSKESEKCLDFVDQCDRLIFAPRGNRVTWIEGKTMHGQRIGNTHTVVDYKTACRDGSVFEEMIKKYGVPNKKYPHCNRELKLNPIHSYCRSIGWETGSYDTAIGIRADEIDRMSITANQRRIIYPMVKWGVKKADVNRHFRDAPFRLELKGYQSNCQFCFKKSLRKHLTLIKEDASIFEFPRRMENQYGLIGGEFGKSAGAGQTPLPDGYRRVFFRGGLSTEDLFALYEKQKATFIPAEDDAQIYPEGSFFDELMDGSGGCGESCEIWSDETDEEAYREAG